MNASVMERKKPSKTALFMLFLLLGTSFLPVSATRNGKVILTFDDGVQQQKEDVSADIMDEYGYRGVAFLITDYTRNLDVWCSLLSKGWELGSHTCNHVRLDQLSADELQYEIEHSKEWIEQTFSLKVVSFSYPYSRGTGNDTILEAISQADYLYARGGPNLEWNGGQSYQIPSTPFTPETYKESVKEVIRQSAEHGIAVAMFHGVNDDDKGWEPLTSKQFRYCLEEIKNSGAEVVTFRDLEPLSMIFTDGQANRIFSAYLETYDCFLLINITVMGGRSPYNVTLWYNGESILQGAPILGIWSYNWTVPDEYVGKRFTVDITGLAVDADGFEVAAKPYLTIDPEATVEPATPGLPLFCLAILVCFVVAVTVVRRFRR